MNRPMILAAFFSVTCHLLAGSYSFERATIYPATGDILQTSHSIEMRLVQTLRPETKSPESPVMDEQQPVLPRVDEMFSDEWVVPMPVWEVAGHTITDVSKEQIDSTVFSKKSQGAFAEAEGLPFYNTAPDYPKRARKRGLEGKVVLRVRILPNGFVDSAMIEQSSGYAVLDHAARTKILQWRFQPAMRKDTPVESWLDIPIRFEIQGS